MPAPPTYRSTGGPGEVLSLAVGIDDYPGSSADLRWAGADAMAVDEALAPETVSLPAPRHEIGIAGLQHGHIMT